MLRPQGSDSTNSTNSTSGGFASSNGLAGSTGAGSLGFLEPCLSLN
jgi:hypothetical protein